MKYLITLIGFVLVIACQSKPSGIISELTGDLKSDVKMLVPEGKTEVDVMDMIKQTPRQIELTEKFQNGIREHYDWFVEQMKNASQGKPMKYHPNLGMTEEEYKELQDYMNNIEVLSSGKEQIEITHREGVISFKCRGKLAFLDSVELDINKNTARIGKYILNFSDTVNVKDESNGFKSKWKGYTWRYEEPKGDIDYDVLKDLSALSMKQYKLTIGRLNKTSKAFIIVKASELEAGVKTVNYEIPLFF